MTADTPLLSLRVLESAGAALRAGDLARAESLAQAVLAAHPDLADAAHILGVIAHRRGQNLEALPLIDRALALNDANAEAHGNRGTVLCALSRFADAVQSFDTAIASGAASAETHCNRGLALHELGRFGEATESFRKSLQLQPDLPAAHAGLAATLCECGEHQAAVDHEAQAFAGRTDWNSRMDRLVAEQRYAEATQLLDYAMHRIMRTSATNVRVYDHESGPGHSTDQSIRRVLVDRSHHLMHPADTEDLARSCGLPVRLADFAAAPPDELGLTADTLAIYSHGILMARSATLRALKRTEPACTVVAWSFANHVSYLANTMLATAADVLFPAHAMPVNYMARWAAGPLGPVVPLALFQWSRPELARLCNDCRGEPRSDALSGHFSLYAAASQRNRLIVEAIRRWPDADLSLRRGWRYHALSPRDRFLRWRRFKCSLVLPVHGDLSMRFFDALAAGQVPIVARDILDFDRIIPPRLQASLPVVRLERYDLEALRAAHAAAIAAFDRGGEVAAAERQRFVVQEHTLAHRIRDIVAHVAGAKRP